MRAPESAIKIDELKIRDTIEYSLGEDLIKQSKSDGFESSFGIPGPAAHDAELHVHAPADSDSVLVTVFIVLQDLLALDRDWDGFSYPKPRKSPNPYETELGDHGEKYAKYRDIVLETVITELGLKQGYSVSDTNLDDDGLTLQCQEYEGAHQHFGPDLSMSAPFLCGLKREPFWELNRNDDEDNGGQ